MAANSHYSQRTPAEWTGAQALMQKWLARRCAAESMLNLVGSVFFLAFGLVALAVTSGAGAGVVFFILVSVNSFCALFGVAISVLHPGSFVWMVLIFVALTIVYAYLTRTDADTPAKFELTIGFGLVAEIVLAGPILLVMSGQEFHRYLRLTRLDVPQVSALLLWVYDKGGRASFAEICLAFPELNAVRVLPQLRDLPDIHWWAADGEVSFSDALIKTFAELLRRDPKTTPFGYSRPREHAPKVEIDPEIRSAYAALNLPLFANLQEVKKRYRKLAKTYHPDAQSSRPHGNKVSNDDEMKRINEAYHNILRHSQGKAGFTP